MTINRMLFTDRGSRWSPTTPSIPDPLWMEWMGGAAAGFALALAVWVML